MSSELFELGCREEDVGDIFLELYTSENHSLHSERVVKELTL